MIVLLRSAQTRGAPNMSAASLKPGSKGSSLEPGTELGTSPVDSTINKPERPHSDGWLDLQPAAALHQTVERNGRYPGRQSDNGHETSRHDSTVKTLIMWSLARTQRGFFGSCGSVFYSDFTQLAGPKSFPLVGTLPHYFVTKKYDFDRLHWGARDKQREFGDVVKEEFSPDVPVLWLYDPEDIKTMFDAEGVYPSRRSHLALAHYRLSKPDVYSSAGLLPTNGPEWKRLRQRFQFKPGAVDKVMPLIRSLAQDFVSTLSMNSTWGMEAELKKYFLEVTSLFLFGARMGALDERSDANVPTLLMEAAYKTNSNILRTDNGLQLWRYFETASYRSIREGQEFIETVARDMLAEHGFRLGQISDGVEETDMFTFVSDMLLAGIDTSTYSTCFLLYHLANNQEEQEKLRQIGASYARLCLRESLRLNPVSIGVGRISASEAALPSTGGRVVVPPGTVMISANQVSCRMEKHFPQPNDFLPERWDRKTQTRPHPFVSVPFGAGQRMCVGRRLAERSILALVEELCGQCKLEWAGQPRLDCKTRLINEPDGPVKVKITRIASQ